MIKTAKPQPKHGILARPDSYAAESRLDPISGDWTIFAPHREQRPDDFVDADEVVQTDRACPFCAGNEANTPPPVWASRIAENDAAPFSCQDAGIEDWSVRVVPNKFPAVSTLKKGAALREFPRHESPLFQHEPIFGGHEVVVESREHIQSLTELDLAEVQLVFQAYRDRMRYWRGLPGIKYISTFKNVGRRAGASLCHSHSQIIATNKIPRAVGAAVERMSRHRAATGCCLSCDLIRAELKAKERLVASDNAVVAFCPFASHLPMLVQITTLEHRASFEDLSDAVLESVSRMVFRVISWLEKLRPGTAYNFCLHTKPPGVEGQSDSYHWSIEIFPRMTQVAGFEWSSDCMINPVLPEVAAAKFRACAKAEDPRFVLGSM